MFSKKRISYEAPEMEVIEIELEMVIAASFGSDMNPLPPNPGNVRQEEYQNAFPKEFEQ